jgi:glycine/D-amino acid oxidase-like deaminating enzyme
VIGAGIAYHLACAHEAEVILCEQAPLPARGATSRSAGLIRMHHTSMDVVPLALTSLRTYAHWHDAVGGDCGFRRTGFALVVGPEHAGELRANVRLLQREGVDTTAVEPEQLRELQPFAAVDDVGAAAYEPESGYADPVSTTLAFLEQARSRGLRVADGATVLELRLEDDRVCGADTNLGEIEAHTTVLAGGAWTAALLRGHGIELPIRSREIGTCLVDASGLPPAPACLTYIDDVTGGYFRPDDTGALVAGVPVERWDVDPDAELPPLELAQLEQARERLAHRIPLLRDAELVGTRPGFDAYTPDKQPLVGRLPELDELYVATGFSGGGFKLAPALGEAVAAELLDDETRPELEPFRPDRFVLERPVETRNVYAHL